MANNRVEYSDIYSETLVKQIQELNKELLDSVTMIEKLAKQGVTLSTVTQDVSNNISEQTKKEKELFDFEKKSLEQQKSYEKINKQLLDQQEKLSEAVLRKKKADADALAIAKQQAIINDKEAGTLEKLTAEYKLLEIQKRKINQETEEGRKQYASMVRRMDELTASIKKQGSEAEKQRMNIGNYEGSTVSLRQELKNITMQLAQMQLRGETNSEVFKNLTQRGGEIKDALSDISQRMKVVGSDTKHIDMVVGSFMALGSAVQVAEGSMQLLGVENQDVQKGIQKLVAIQSVMNGVQQIANSLQKESAFMIGLATAKTELLTAAQKVYAVAVGTSTGAMKLFRTALLATGIGAVIAGISLLTEWIINLSNSTDEATDSFDKMNEELERQKKLYEEISKSDQTKFDLQKRQNEEAIRQQKLLGMSEVDLLKLEKQLAENREKQAIENNNNFIKEFGNYEKIKGQVEVLTTLLKLQGMPEEKRTEYSKQLEYYNGLLEESGKCSLEVTMASNDLLEVQNKLNDAINAETDSFNKMNEELERQKKLYEESSKSVQKKFDLQNKQNEEMIRQQKLLGMSEVDLLKLDKQLAENKEKQAIENNNNFIKEFGNYEKINGKVKELTTLLELQDLPEEKRVKYSKQLEYYNGLLEESGKCSLKVTMASNDLLEVQNKLNDVINAENEELERQKKLYEELSKSNQTKFDLQNKQNEEMIRQQKLLGASEVDLLKLEKQLAENREKQAIENNNNFIKEFGNYEKINGKVEELTTLLKLQDLPEEKRTEYSKQLEYYNGLLEESGKCSLEVTTASNDLLEVQNKLNDAIKSPELDTRAEKRMEQLNKIEKKTSEIGELTNMQVEAGAKLADSVFERRQAQLDSNYNKEVANIEAEKQKAIKAGMDKTKAEEIQKNKLEVLDRRNKYESAKNARKAAIWDKTSAIVQAGINTLVSVAKVLWNPFLAAAVGVAGAATVAAIGLKPIPEVPTYRKGTKSHKGGHAIVGEVGEELIETPSGKVFLSPDKPTLMNLPKGTRVTPHDVIKRHLSGFNNAHILTPQPYSDKKMNELIDVVKNKREHIINIDKEGISVIAKNGLNRTKFINSYYRS